MDNTSYRYDLEKPLLPFPENRGILTHENLDQTLKLIDFKDSANFTETLYSHYFACVRTTTLSATLGLHRSGLDPPCVS
jgi:hypothetical protein